MFPGPATDWPRQVKLIAVVKLIPAAEAPGAAASMIAAEARERRYSLAVMRIMSLLGGATVDMQFTFQNDDIYIQ